MLRMTKKDLEALILIAAARLKKYDDLAKNEENKQKAMQFFEKNSHDLTSAADLADLALLGVMSVYTTGTIQPQVRYNWGNMTGVADYSPFDGGSGGGSTLDEVNRIDYRFGQDNLGVEARVIANFINAGEFTPDFIEALQANGILAAPSAPTPKPQTK